MLNVWIEDAEGELRYSKTPSFLGFSSVTFLKLQIWNFLGLHSCSSFVDMICDRCSSVTWVTVTGLASLTVTFPDWPGNAQQILPMPPAPPRAPMPPGFSSSFWLLITGQGVAEDVRVWAC